MSAPIPLSIHGFQSVLITRAKSEKKKSLIKTSVFPSCLVTSTWAYMPPLLHEWRHIGSVHPSLSLLNTEFNLHPGWQNIPQLPSPLLLKIGQQCVLAWKMTGLMAGKGGGSAKVALSWQLSYNKAGQGSPAAQQTEESYLSPSPLYILWVPTPYMSSLTLTFPNARAYVWDEEWGGSLAEILFAAISFLVLMKALMQHLSGKMAEEAVSGWKRRKSNAL